MNERRWKEPDSHQPGNECAFLMLRTDSLEIPHHMFLYYRTACNYLDQIYLNTCATGSGIGRAKIKFCLTPKANVNWYLQPDCTRSASVRRHPSAALTSQPFLNGLLHSSLITNFNNRHTHHCLTFTWLSRENEPYTSSRTTSFYHCNLSQTSSTILNMVECWLIGCPTLMP